MEEKKEPSQPKKVGINLKYNQPMETFDLDPDETVAFSPEQETLSKAVAYTIREYITAARKLLDSKYASIKAFAPRHLREADVVLMICCTDGIIIRYDVTGRNDKPSFNSGCIDQTLSQFAPTVSESVIYCHPDKNFEAHAPDTGVILELGKTDAITEQRTALFKARLSFDAILETPTFELPKPPRKPYCLLNVTNNFEIGIEGESLPNKYSSQDRKKFIMRSKIRIPVGWECIEIFPSTDPNSWKPEFAELWAENDLLASVVTAQARESHFHNLDPKAAARKELFETLKAYKDLLDSNPDREEDIQKFLKPRGI